MSEWTKEEQKEHRNEGAKALRFGEFQQGFGVLKRTDDKYCCLELLASLCKKILRPY